MTDAVIKATYATWKPVPSRKVLQLVFEVPIEQTEHAMKMLGVPAIETATWVAIARLAPEQDRKVREQSEPVAETAGIPETRGAPPKRNWNDISPREQAGIKCGDVDFQRWLRTKYTKQWTDILTAKDGPDTITATDIAAKIVRDICNVASRKDLDTNPEAAEEFRRLLATYDVETKWGRT